MMHVPKRLVTLLPDLVVCSGVHEEHAEEHDMSCNASGLLVVDLHRGLSAELVAFHVEEVDVVAACMNNRPKEQAVSDLPMEPLALIQRQPSDAGPDYAEEVPAHGE